MPNPVAVVRRCLALATLALVLLAGAGCGYLDYLRVEHVRAHALTQELDAYVIPRPIEEVWPSAVDVSGPGESLTAGGLRFVWSATGPWTMRTSAKQEKEGGAGGDRVHVVTWFECAGASVPGGSQVRFLEVSERTTFRGSEDLGKQKREDRRTDLELQIVRKFDPDSARRIETAGESAAQKAR